MRICDTPGCGRKHRAKGLCINSPSQSAYCGTMVASPNGAGNTIRGLTRSTSITAKEGLMPNSIVGKNDPFILASIHIDGWLDRRVWPRLNGYPDATVCWEWVGAKHPSGYGFVRLPSAAVAVDHSPVYVHRVAWIALRGSIPAGLMLDHDGATGCHNRSCANPAHLALATAFENSSTGQSPAGLNAPKTHCPKGHVLSGSNLVRAALSRGGRNCRTCQIEGAAEQYRLVMAAAGALGMTRRAYVASHGSSRGAALAVLAEFGVEGGAA